MQVTINSHTGFRNDAASQRILTPWVARRKVGTFERRRPVTSDDTDGVEGIISFALVLLELLFS
jgi:hypothetical protein